MIWRPGREIFFWDIVVLALLNRFDELFGAPLMICARCKGPPVGPRPIALFCVSRSRETRTTVVLAAIDQTFTV